MLSAPPKTWWLLLAPPLQEHTNILRHDLKQPYSKWSRIGAYETATDCESHRVEQSDLAKKLVEESAKELGNKHLSANERSGHEAMIETLYPNIAARCVRNDALFSSQPNK